MIPVSPKSKRLHSWDYDHAIYKRNEMERLFRRLKGVRRIFSRSEKLNVLFLAFLSFALIIAGSSEAWFVVQVNQPMVNEALTAHSDDVDQSFRSDADQFGAKATQSTSV